MPATTHLNCFKLLVNLATGVHGLKRARQGYRLQFVDRGKRDQKIYQNIRDEILDNNPESIPFPFFVEPLDAIEISAWPAKAQGILTVATKSLQFELPLIRFFEREEPRLVREDPE